MARSESARQVDAIQRELAPLFEERGFRRRARTFNRRTDAGWTQVVNFQLGASPPPGTHAIPGFREDLAGWFTVNLGVRVPIVARHTGGEVGSWVHEYDCQVRVRLGTACGEDHDLWWAARACDEVLDDLRARLDTGFEFLERFSTEDGILAEWRERVKPQGASHSPRVVTAILLAESGELDAARSQLERYARESMHPRRRTSIRELARELGLGSVAL